MPHAAGFPVKWAKKNIARVIVDGFDLVLILEGEEGRHIKNRFVISFYRRNWLGTVRREG
jgi:hypothetical protein